MAIKMHSKTKNNLRNGPNHVFGDHSQCNPFLCKAAMSSSNNHSDSDSWLWTWQHQHAWWPSTTSDGIVANELDDEPTATDELDAHNGGQRISSLPIRLIEKVKAAGDWLVVLSASLNDNEISNLAKCHMSIRTLFDGGKHYNHIQSGSFIGRCYAAGLRVCNVYASLRPD
jgi:hypothetical protein